MIDFEKLKSPFKENEIDWRVAQSSKSIDGKPWAKVLAYVQARAIQDRLDETVGPMNWRVEYEFIQGPVSGVICKMALRSPGTQEWITKEDGAEQTDIEAFKGGISSAMKRAAVTWGIGRYLYDLEEYFAVIVEKGGRYAKLKEGGAFYWMPPKLPAWALPKNVDTQQPVEEVRAHTQQTATVQPLHPKPLVPTGRDAVGAEIMRLRTELRMSNEDVSQWAKNMTGKEVLKDLTDKQLEELKTQMQAEAHGPR